MGLCLGGTKRPSEHMLHISKCKKRCWNKKDFKYHYLLNTSWILTTAHEDVLNQYFTSFNMLFLTQIIKTYLLYSDLHDDEILYSENADALYLCHAYCHPTQYIVKRNVPCFMKVMDTFRVTIIGDKYVGKTNIATRYALNAYGTDHSNHDILSKHWQLNKQYDITILVAPHSYNEEEPVYNELAIHPALFFVIVFSIDNRESLNNVEKYIDIIKKEKVNSWGEKKCYGFVLVGNKIDLRYDNTTDNDKELINMEDALSVAKKLDVPYIEVSAKDDQNIQFLFKQIMYEYWMKWALTNGGEDL